MMVMEPGCSPKASNGTLPAAAVPRASPPPSTADAQQDRSVWVAVRARPLVARERLEGAKACIAVSQAAGSVHLGARQFTYDYAFGPEAQQQDVYAGCVSSLVDSVLEGYNATVLAYGPTGSGKTHTMGLTSALHSMENLHGIIPRVIRQLFDKIGGAPEGTAITVKAQFLEIYNEELRDLLGGLDQQGSATDQQQLSSSSPQHSPGPACSGSPSQQRSIVIRECPDGQITVNGAREVTASSAEDLLKLLDTGALTRATSGTLLNEQSSRSHAIYTIVLEQRISRTLDSTSSSTNSSSATASDSGTGTAATSSTDSSCSSSGGGSHGAISEKKPHSRTACADTRGDGGCAAAQASSTAAGAGPPVLLEYRCSKFHLVDLAGSERASRSGVGGMRFKETVNINQGLLALGNVISALSDGDRRPRHVPYRDSKLTRLLQDSLGGNSKTLMIACVSSADDAVEESLNTLKYAARARSMRNRPVLNRQCLVDGSRSAVAEVQALQLQLLRRLLQQMLGASYTAALPELLLKDAGPSGGCSPCGDAGVSARQLKMLQGLQAMTASSWPAQVAAGLPDSSNLQQQPAAFSEVAQQLADLESKVVSANNHIMRLELQLDVCAAERHALEQAAAAQGEQQGTAWKALLQEVHRLHADKQLSDAARQQLQELAQRHHQVAGPHSLLGSCQPADTPRRTSVHSYPLPEEHSSFCEQLPAENSAAVPSASDSMAEQPFTIPSSQTHGASQALSQLKAELAQKTASLELVRGDLTVGDQVFKETVMEVSRLQAELSAATERAQTGEASMAARLQHAQADIRRWRARALAMQACTADPSQQQERPALPPPPSPPSSQTSQQGAPSGPTSLQQELSFAALPKQQHSKPPGQPDPSVSLSKMCADSSQPQQQPQDSASAPAYQQGAVAASLPRLQVGSSAELGSEELYRSTVSGKAAGAADEDQVLFDADLASYISETDYTDLCSADVQVDSHLLAELQVVLADKAALEEEKAAAQAEAAAAQRAFEHSRAMLEGQLSQLSTAISSQEALIATLQANEAEAKNLGALYLERCRELEVQLADLNLDLQELTAALARVEADAAASAEEKQQLRKEYERKIDGVVKQMAGLQQQMKQQDGTRVEKERQRAAGRVQQLQSELSTMRAQQDSLRQRLQDRLTAQERDASAKARELASLRRAGEAAKRRVLELEDENRRQRAALKASSSQAAAAQRQLRELASRVSPARSRPGQSPRASPRATTFRVSPAASPRHSTASPKTPTRASPRASPLASPRHSPSPARTAGHSSGDSANLPEQPAGSSSSPQSVKERPGQQKSGTSGSGSLDSKQLLTKHVQLLVSEYLAKHRLKQLQAKQAAVVSRREQLLATKAQLELKQLRRAQAGAAAPILAGSAGSCSASTSDPTDQVLLADFADQLDSVGAQLQHIQQLMQQAAAEAAAAAEGAAQLMQAAGSMGRQQLQELLGLALKELALQAAECQETVNQSKRLQVDLQEAQQQLHETSACLQMVQLQSQTQLLELQREHERRVMGLFRQQPAAAETATACTTASSAGQASGLVPAAGSGTGSQAVVHAAGAGATDAAGLPAELAGRQAPQVGQSCGRLVGLLSLLAQQGTEEQQQKLNSTLSRLQLLQEQQQQVPQQEEAQRHVTAQGRQQPQQEAVGQQDAHSRHHLEQLQKLKQCRAQQQLRQLEGLLSPRAQQQVQQHLVQGQPSCEQVPTQPPASLEQRRQSLQQLQQLLLGGRASAHSSDAPGSADCSDDSDGGSSSSPTSSSRASSPEENAGCPGIVRCSSAGFSTRPAAAAAAGSAGSANNSLRASASRLQAKLCGYRQPDRLPVGSSPRTSGILESSSGSARGRSSSGWASPRASVGSAARHQLSEESRAQSERSTHSGSTHSLRASAGDAAPQQGLELRSSAASPASRGNARMRALAAASTAAAAAAADGDGLDGGASPTAAMLRKAAQLAMSSSLDLTRSPGNARPPRSQLSAAVRSPGAGSLQCRSSAGSQAPADDRGGGWEQRGSGPSSWSLRAHRSSGGSSGSRGSGGSCADRLPSPSASVSGRFEAAAGQSVAAAAVRQQPHSSSRRVSNSHTDCLRPASLDVPCISGETFDMQPQQQPTSSSAGWCGAGSGGSSDLDALPGSAASSPGKDTKKATAAVPASPSGGGVLRSPHASACRSPYQQYKASAAAVAAAVAGKDQQLTPGRRGLPQSPPSAYMRLLQGLD